MYIKFQQPYICVSLQLPRHWKPWLQGRQWDPHHYCAVHRQQLQSQPLPRSLLPGRRRYTPLRPILSCWKLKMKGIIYYIIYIWKRKYNLFWLKGNPKWWCLWGLSSKALNMCFFWTTWRPWATQVQRISSAGPKLPPKGIKCFWSTWWFIIWHSFLEFGFQE